jgi:hypothetical protein
VLSSAHRRLLLVTTIAMAMLPAGVACAIGSPMARVHGTLLAPPVWAGSSAVGLFEAGGSSAVQEIELPGGSTRQLATVPHRYMFARLLGSASLTAVQGMDVECAAVEEEGAAACRRPHYRVQRDELLAISPGSAPRCLFGQAAMGCLGPPACELWVPEALLSGTTFAYPLCDGSSESGTELLDAANAATDRLVPQIVEPEAFAGEWLVGLSPGWRGGTRRAGAAPALVEVNLTTGAETLHIPVHPPRQEISFRWGGTFPALAAVEADGTVAYALAGKEGGATLWTATPGGPPPRQLPGFLFDSSRPGLRFNTAALQLAGKRIAISAPSDAEVVSAAGGAPAHLNTPWLDGFDFDGGRSLVGATPCGESFVGTWTPGGPEPLGPGGDCPGPRLLRASLYAHGLTLRLSCPTREDLGCPPTQMLVDGQDPSPPGTYLPVFAAESDAFQMLPGARRTVSIPLGRRSLRWLRNPRRRISVGIVQVPGGEHGEERVPTVRVRVAR